LSQEFRPCVKELSREIPGVQICRKCQVYRKRNR